MSETSARLLQLLSLLQMHRDWSGTELSERLHVTPRTVRRDVDRLRALGYPVQATRGTSGYRLGAGAQLPPLLLNDEEAVAVVMGLRAAADGSVRGIEEASVRALSKLEQVLPSRLRHRVDTLQQSTIRAGVEPGPTVEVEVLVAVAEACRRRERLRFDYTSPRGGESVRSVEPHSVVNFGRRWYLVSFDVERDDWRTFRIDRMRPRIPTGPRFTPRDIPYGDAASYVSHQLSWGTWPFQAIVKMHHSAEVVLESLWPGMGTVEPIDEHSCLLQVGAETAADLTWMITSLQIDFTVVEGPTELYEELRRLGSRCERAVRGL